MKAKGSGLLLGVAVCALLGASPSRAADRITAALAGAPVQRLAGSRHPLARPERAVGRLAGTGRLAGVALHFRPSPAQQAELEALLARQQDPASPDYHRWLTPEAYGARFGLGDADLARVTAWLAAQGLEVQEVAPSRNRIAFGGTVARLEAAFGTQLLRYDVDGERHFAPAGELGIPAPLAGALSSVRGLDDFRPRPRARPTTAPAPRFSANSNTTHFLAPGDVATIYDVDALHAAGYTGAGQLIGVIGQSDLDLADVTAFRTAAGISGPAPTKVQVPNSGTAAVVSGDVDEAALDVEWSNALAPGAQVIFVFTGDATNKNAWDALVYLVEQDQVPVISVSYGVCEAQAGSDAATLRSYLQQAQGQGQTVIAASGDSGAAGCDGFSSAAASHGYATDLPASYPEVTGVGGTTLSGDLSSPALYWKATNDAGGASARSYIPETAWNDTGTSLSASGGGASSLYPKPAWQAGAGVPADGKRDVPDLALAASASHDGYLYCVAGGCTSGFKDGSNRVHLIGGTSAGAPVFSGLVTVLLQATGGGRQGLLNPTLYALAAGAPQAFHDVITGDNQVPCTSGSSGCPSSLELGFTAAAGYDQVTGLGSVDGYQLLSAWPDSLQRSRTSTALASSATSAVPGGTITLTAQVLAQGAAVPDGSIVKVLADGVVLDSVAVASGQAVTSFDGLTRGVHALSAVYLGDAQFAPSIAPPISVTVQDPVPPSSGGCATGAGQVTTLAILAALALRRRRARA